MYDGRRGSLGNVHHCRPSVLVTKRRNEAVGEKTELHLSSAHPQISIRQAIQRKEGGRGSGWWPGSWSMKQERH